MVPCRKYERGGGRAEHHRDTDEEAIMELRERGACFLACCLTAAEAEAEATIFHQSVEGNRQFILSLFLSITMQSKP
jgi:hypothetical protein